MAYIFKYSVRTGTPAADDAGPGARRGQGGAQPDPARGARESSLRRSQALVGTVQEVLVEGPDKTGVRFTGRTRGNRVAVFEAAPRLVGSLVPVEIDAGQRQHALREPRPSTAPACNPRRPPRHSDARLPCRFSPPRSSPALSSSCSACRS